MLYAMYADGLSDEYMELRYQNSKKLGMGILPGWRLVSQGFPDIKKDSTYEGTPVALWDIAEEDQEQFRKFEAVPVWFSEHLVSIDFNDGKIDAYVLALNIPWWLYYRPFAPVALEGILKGCEESGIDPQYVYDAHEYAKTHEEEYYGNTSV